MTKPISTKVHGVIDHVAALTFPTLARALGWGPRATTLMDGAGLLSFTYALVTKYELGVVRVLPMKTHLKIDAMQGGALLAASLLLDEEENDTRATIAGLGVFCMAASMLTQERPGGSELRKSHANETAPGVVQETEIGTVAASENI